MMIKFLRKRYIAYIIATIVVLVSTIHLFITYTPSNDEYNVVAITVEYAYEEDSDEYDAAAIIAEYAYEGVNNEYDIAAVIAEYTYEEEDDDEIDTQELPNATPSTAQLVPTPQEGSISYEITNIQERFFENRLGDFRYEALIQVTNTGTIPMFFGTSRFDLIDENDRVLTANNTFTARPRVLHPGERGYLWASERVTGATFLTEAALVPRWDIDRSIHYRANLEISDVEVREHPNRFIDSLIVLGMVTNNTDAEIGRADIVVALYTHDGIPIGVWHTSVRDLPAGESFGFETSSANTTFTDLTADIVGDFTTFAIDSRQRNR